VKGEGGKIARVALRGKPQLLDACPECPAWGMKGRRSAWWRAPRSPKPSAKRIRGWWRKDCKSPSGLTGFKIACQVFIGRWNQGV